MHGPVKMVNPEQRGSGPSAHVNVLASISSDSTVEGESQVGAHVVLIEWPFKRALNIIVALLA